MIDIVVRPKRYTRDELQDLFSRYSDRDEDFEEFITAMQTTGQLEEQEDAFIPTVIKVEERKTRQYKTFGTMLYGGKKDARYPRLGIHVLEREGMRLYPTEMQIIRYQDTKGRWITIPEAPSMKLTKPRSYEKWRASIPMEIIRKYDLKIDTPIRVRIGSVSKRYFSRLRLWGYNLQAMVSFGETGGGKNVRDLEVHGWDFPFETKGLIRNEMTVIGMRSVEVMRGWLERYDMDYYGLLRKCEDADTASEAIPPALVEGVAPEPLMSAPRRKAEIHLLDHDAKTVDETRARVAASLPRNWYDLDPEQIAMLFTFPSVRDDDIGEAKGYHGRSGEYHARRQGSLDEFLKKGKEGEGFKKKK